MLKKTILLLALIYSYSILAQIPDYYSSIDFNLDGTSVRVQLSDLIINTHHTFIPYTSSSTDTWDIIRNSDLEFENSENVLLIYGYDDDDGMFISDRTRNKYNTCHTSSCIGLWNREHVFARSLANPSLTTFEPGPGTDVHNLRAADSQKNTQRSNRLFINGEGHSKIIDDNFYPGDEWKGDIARIIMYMYLRYPGQCEATNSAVGSITYAPENDMPDLFLEWNQQDPVSELEIVRNNTIHSYQGNRNPFIDNPFLATLIWGGPETVDVWAVLSDLYLHEDSITISPSLTKNLIKLHGIKESKFKVLIINQLGQKVIEIENKRSIDVSNLNVGVYYLKLFHLNTVLQFKFIVK
jgi:endonuclease I